MLISGKETAGSKETVCSKENSRQALLISACLLGQPVRYDGDHAQISAALMTQLNANFTLVPICPELLGGLSTPRLPAEIVCQDERIEVINISGESLTDAFHGGANKAGDIALQHGIKRALLKSKSPSCGSSLIYDGSFTGRLRAGNGITTQHLQSMGVQVFHEDEIELLLTDI